MGHIFFIHSSAAGNIGWLQSRYSTMSNVHHNLHCLASPVASCPIPHVHLQQLSQRLPLSDHILCANRCHVWGSLWPVTSAPICLLCQLNSRILPPNPTRLTASVIAGARELLGGGGSRWQRGWLTITGVHLNRKDYWVFCDWQQFMLPTSVIAPSQLQVCVCMCVCTPWKHDYFCFLSLWTWQRELYHKEIANVCFAEFGVGRG